MRSIQCFCLFFALALHGPVLAAAAAQTSNPGEPLPTFSGVMRSVDAKMLRVEKDDGNIMEFYCTRKTVYQDAKRRRIKFTELKPGDALAVEGRAAIDNSLEAVRVTVVPPSPR